MVKFNRRRILNSKPLRFRLVFLTLVSSFLLSLLSACGEPSATPLPPTTAPVTTAAATTAPATTAAVTTAPVTTATTTGAATVPAEIQKAFSAITPDLQKRSNLPATSFQVVSYQPQTFPTSALGCPDPGLEYLQVLTPGFQIEVAAGGKNYDYRTNQAGTHVILCGDNGQPVKTP